MPCTYYQSPAEIREEERERVLKEIVEGRTLLEAEERASLLRRRVAEMNKLITEREALIDQQERVMCKMFNTLFDQGMLHLVLGKDDEIDKHFNEHQHIDRQQGRPFLILVDGKYARVNFAK